MAGPPRMLHVDDDPAVRELVRHVVDGVEVLEAGDVREALDVLEREAGLRLVLLDLDLPDGRGLDVLRERQGGAGAHVPVVVLSSSEDPEDVRAALELGARAYVRKPAEFPRLREALQAITAFWLAWAVPVPEETP